MRIADSGLGWKAAATGGSATKNAPFLLPSEQIVAGHWSRGSRGWELRIYTKSQGVARLDGFDQQDFQGLKSELSRFFNIGLDHKEHSMRGWNWGKTDLNRSEICFNVNNRPNFEIPYSFINNSNLTGKNEISVELSCPGDEMAGDELVEARFYIPGNVENEKDDAKEEMSAAQAFYDDLRDKAQIGQVAGEAIVSFSDVLFLTPRGRYDIDMYPNSLRLRGKTYDYKIQYQQVKKIFSLPKPDDIHHLMILQIDPPLRQGQTRYPFLTMQFDRSEELEVELDVDEAEFEEKYKDRLNKKYNDLSYLVLSHCFRGLTERRITAPTSFTSKMLQPAISCSVKASEGHLYPLDKCFLFVTKPTIYVPFSEVVNVTMSRVATRTFDLVIHMRGAGGSHTFGNINRDEQQELETFCKEKGLKVKNDDVVAQERINAVLEDDDSSDEDVVMRGSADEDESEDEDFKGGESDGDLAEEYDSDAKGTDSENEDGSPPKKKSKN